MKELAKQFVGKECLVWMITSDSSIIKGTIVDVQNDGMLMKVSGNMQAVNLEYVTRIQEFTKKSKARQKKISDWV